MKMAEAIHINSLKMRNNQNTPSTNTFLTENTIDRNKQIKPKTKQRQNGWNIFHMKICSTSVNDQRR